jgi:hypothetical protein
MTTNDMRIWKLVGGGNRYIGLIPHELAYFQTHFIGRPMPIDWVPPPVTISGKSKKLSDFVIWMLTAPVVSEKARIALESAFNDYVQFLPFHHIKDKPYFVMNVTCLVENLLDVSSSDISYGSDGKRILNINRAVFKQPLPEQLPPIFKLAIDPTDIFVTQAFADLAIKYKLTGLSLSEPGVDGLKLILKGQDPNVVPGIVR